LTSPIGANNINYDARGSLAMKHFDRWAPGWGRTVAHRLFQSHHTQLNALYWAHAPVFRHAFAATRRSEKTDATTTIFPLPAEDVRRINYPLHKWASYYNEFDNWVRLNAVVSATGYLEVYMKTLIRMALESDPGVMIGASHAVDGVRLLKTQSAYNFKDEVVDCVRGAWDARLSHYGRLFGHVPPFLKQVTGELDQLRVLRNGVTHTFGRSTDDYDSYLDVTPKPFAKVSVAKLKKSLGLIERVALALDKHLGAAHIGEYESLYMYHVWDKDYAKDRVTEAKAFATHVFAIHGWIRPREYYAALIDHYHAV
jgi:hypothetical protein